MALHLFFRLGKVKSVDLEKPRLIKVIFNSPELRNKVFTELKKNPFEGTDHSGLKFASDFTFLQRQERNQAYKELELKKSTGDVNWIVRGTKLVRKKPQ